MDRILRDARGSTFALHQKNTVSLVLLAPVGDGDVTAAARRDLPDLPALPELPEPFDVSTVVRFITSRIQQRADLPLELRARFTRHLAQWGLDYERGDYERACCD